jgi:hypothetical protein
MGDESERRIGILILMYLLLFLFEISIRLMSWTELILSIIHTF